MDILSIDILNEHLPNNNIVVQKDIVKNYPIHTHSNFEIILYEAFSGEVTINDEIFSMDSPTAFIIPPSSFHKINVTDKPKSKYIKIGINEIVLKDITKNLPQNSLFIKKTDDIRFISQLFLEISNNRTKTSYILALIHALIEHFILFGIQIKPTTVLKKHQLAINALKYINDNFANDITLTDIAKVLSVSPQYLSNIFSKENGITISAYINQLRLKKSSEMLIFTDKSITEICFECGFRNLSYFLRNFKSKYKISPKQYQISKKSEKYYTPKL